MEMQHRIKWYWMKYNNTIGYDRIRSDQTVHVSIGCGIVKTSKGEKNNYLLKS